MKLSPSKNKEKTYELIALILKGTLREADIFNLIKGGASVDMSDENGTTLVMHCKNDSFKRILISCSDDRNHAMSNNVYPWHAEKLSSAELLSFDSFHEGRTQLNLPYLKSYLEKTT
jgi:hypothetical protein